MRMISWTRIWLTRIVKRFDSACRCASMRVQSSVADPRRRGGGVASLRRARVARRVAQQTRDLRMCATQTRSLADQRIAACTALLKSGRLRGKPLGVAYELARPRLSRPRRHPARHRRPQPRDRSSRRISRPPTRTAATPGTRAAITARRSPITTPRSSSIPNSPSPYVNRATVRRDLGYTEGALEDYQKAISLGSDRASAYRGRGQLYLRSGDYAKAHRRLRPRAQARPGRADITCCARRRARTAAISTARSPTTRKPRGATDKNIAGIDRASPASGASTAISTRRSPSTTAPSPPTRSGRRPTSCAPRLTPPKASASARWTTSAARSSSPGTPIS